MKKKLIIIASLLFLFVLAFVLFIAIGTKPASNKDNKDVTFTVEAGSSRYEIIDDLNKAGLIKNKLSAYLYVTINRSLNLQSGTYNLKRSMSLSKILKKFDNGEIVDLRKTKKITFIDGKRLTDYADQIAKFVSENTGDIITKEDVIKEISDKEYVKSLINNYWFLTDEILNDEIYYPLEGYLSPNTYEFYTDASVKDIIKKMLDTTSSVLEPLKNDIEKSGYTVHEILSAAAIIEKEANSKEDREKVSQVIYKRLKINMALGMDVTAYYAAKADQSEPYMYAWNNLASKYNTRNINNVGLPIGPICNPSLISIKAALNPSNTNYLYFYADMQTGKVYFAEDYNGFIQIQRNLGVK